MKTSDLLRLIEAVKTCDESFYHGDVHSDLIEALGELVQRREQCDEIKDILSE